MHFKSTNTTKLEKYASVEHTCQRLTSSHLGPHKAGKVLEDNVDIGELQTLPQSDSNPVAGCLNSTGTHPSAKVIKQS